MPPSLEGYVYKTTKLQPQEVGRITETEVNCGNLIANRPFLTPKKYAGIRRRGSREHPDIISYHGSQYIVDGHHKVRKALDTGKLTIKARVLTTGNQRIGAKLQRTAIGLITELPIDEQ